MTVTHLQLEPYQLRILEVMLRLENLLIAQALGARPEVFSVIVDEIPLDSHPSTGL